MWNGSFRENFRWKNRTESVKSFVAWRSEKKPGSFSRVLKTQGGDIAKLKRNLAEATGYCREHIGEAEYPNYMKKILRIDQLTEADKSELFEKDKKQYLAWLQQEKADADR